MIKFCNEQFYDPRSIWEEQIPYISSCFQSTVFSYIPCIYLFLFAPYEVLKIKSLAKKTVPWTLVNISKILFSLLLAILCLVQLFSYVLASEGDETFFSAQIVQSMIEIISFVIIFMLTLYQRKKNVHTSGVVFMFWFFFAVLDVISYVLVVLHTFKSTNVSLVPTDEFHFVYRTLHVSFVVSSLFLNCVSDYKIDYNTKSCPINKASFLSTLTFWWFNSMISLGHKKALTEQDMWSLNDEFKTKTAYDGFFKQYIKYFKRFKTAKAKAKLDEERQKFLEKELKREMNKANTTKVKDINLIGPFFRTYKVELICSASYKLISILSGFVQPFVLDYILTYIRSQDAIIWKGYFYAVIMLAASAVESILNNQYEISINEVAMKLKAALTVTIYKKSLALSASGRKDFSTGETLNLMGIDIQRIIDYLIMCNLIWSSILQIVISVILIWFQLGIATLSGIGVMVAMMIPNALISNLFKTQQQKQMINKDGRSKTLNEALSGIKVLKLYAWTDAFKDRISMFRNNEIRSLRTIMICFSILVFSFNMAPFFVSLASFLTYVFVYTEFEDRLDANKIFVSLSLFNIIRIPLGLLPILISNGLMSWVSIKRINRYLSGDELDETKNEKVKDRNYPIKMDQCFFKWNLENDGENEYTLKDISFKVKRKSLVAIVGAVGCGKSSLFSALLGEMHKTNGKMVISDTIAYIPQIAWIQNATVRDNIVFGEPFDKKKYDEIIEKAQLKQDLKILNGGDLCEIGEKGINLSGGQKQRINIARAIYSDKSIYLFDDPLSALDSNVGKEIFDKVISNDGILRNKTRLLVTHRISLLQKVDHIIVMKDGRISEQGSYPDLMEKKGDFSDLVLQFLSDAYHEIEDKEELELLNQLKDKIPEIELSKSFVRSVSTASPTKVVDQSMRSIESSRNVSSSMYQGSRRLERTESNLSRSSVQLEMDKKIEKQLRQDSMKAKKSKEKGKLIENEKMETGSVKRKVYIDYIKALGIWWYLLTILCYIISHAFNVFSQLWLSKWSDDSINPANFNDTALRNRRLVGYSGYGIGEMVFVFISTIALSLACLQAAKKIHALMLSNVFGAPMSFFDTTPLGRIANRFTKDIDTADFGINMNVRGVLIYNFRALVSFTLITIETPWFLIALVPIVIIYCVIQTFYISTSRQLKRLESTTRSPIFSHFQETVTGASSIRAYNLKDKFIQECCNRVDANHRIYYPNINAVRWLTLRLEFLGYIIVFLSALFAIVFRDTLSPGLVGVSITSALTITNTLNNLIKSFSDLETNIVSIERCLEYTKIDSERPDEIPENKPNKDWPSNGVIKFENYSTKYRPDLELVLKSISFQIKDGEKVGIVGRTGSGKSTITLSLFRIIESVTGQISIDNVNIGQIGLKDLRSKISIIPQDPVLFTGTLRFNLDPYSSYTDDDLWKALEQAHLRKFVANLESQLEYNVAEGGENLSIGQRQLICLARALLRRSKILVLDEATASVDLETDELIQSTIRREFDDTTIITIAHRLNTIMDYDKILVLDQGKLREFASPDELLKDKNSIFYDMAEKSGLLN